MRSAFSIFREKWPDIELTAYEDHERRLMTVFANKGDYGYMLPIIQIRSIYRVVLTIDHTFKAENWEYFINTQPEI